MKEICEKVRQEIEEYKSVMVQQGAEEVYMSAYEISMMEELNYFFTDYVIELDESDEFDLERIRKYDGLTQIDHLCEEIINFYYGMRHSEYYDFHNIESLMSIIDFYIEELNKENKNG